jgi:two-component system LytT family response regulator
MKIYKVIIVDDELTAREILEHHLQKIEVIEVIASCKNALEAFSILNKEAIDLIFLDINMPNISGLSFAKAIGNSTKIIFTTAYRDYAIDGFELQAVDYLLKPISLERLIQAVKKFQSETVISTPKLALKNDFLFVRSDRKMVKINFQDILFIESLGDYLKINTTEKVITIRETISNIETQLSENFIRCHRSFLIAFSKITAFTNEQIEIDDKIIPISRSHRKAILDRLSGN